MEQKTDTSAPSRRNTKPRTASKPPQPVPPTQDNEAILLNALHNGSASVLTLAFNVGICVDAEGAKMELPAASYAIVMLHDNPPDLHGLYAAEK